MNEKKTILLGMLVGIIIGFFIGRYDFSQVKIKNPFRNVIIIKNEEELEQVVGDFLDKKEQAECDEDDLYFYTYQWLGEGSKKNFRIVCGYYSNIRIHEEKINIDGKIHYRYCDQQGRCVYGGR